MGELIDYPVGDGLAFGYLARPASGGGRGVLVLQEWWGLLPHIKEVADRLAAAGFVALAPDFWDGEVAETADEASRRFLALTLDTVAARLRGAIGALHGEGGAVGKLGVVGFGMGGALALFAAGDNPGTIGACASFYGVHPHIHPDLARLRAPVLGVYGEHDAFVPPEVARGLQADVRAHGGQMELSFHDAGHAFFNDTRPMGYQADAARDAWQKTLAFLAAHL